MESNKKTRRFATLVVIKLLTCILDRLQTTAQINYSTLGEANGSLATLLQLAVGFKQTITLQTTNTDRISQTGNGGCQRITRNQSSSETMITVKWDCINPLLFASMGSLGNHRNLLQGVVSHHVNWGTFRVAEHG